MTLPLTLAQLLRYMERGSGGPVIQDSQEELGIRRETGAIR